MDILYRETVEIPEGARVFSVEALPGQFDQRADSAVQCIQLLNPDSSVVIHTAQTYILTGDITDAEFERIKADIMRMSSFLKASTQCRKMSSESFMIRSASR